MERRDSALAIGSIIAIAALLLAVLVLGVVIVANERDIDINVPLVSGALLVSLGFVGLCAVLWQSIRRLMD